MRAVLSIVAIFLVSINASNVVPIPGNYQIEVEDVIREALQIVQETGEILVGQYEQIVSEPIQEVEAAVNSIEERKQESQECVEAVEPVVASVVDAMHDDMNVCGVVAAKTAASIMKDVNAAMQQIIFDGYDVLKTYQKCQKYKNPLLKNTCYTRLSIKGALYLRNSRKSTKTIKKSINERVPAVFTDGEICTHTAADQAVLQLDIVQKTIDDCIAKN